MTISGTSSPTGAPPTAPSHAEANGGTFRRILTRLIPGLGCIATPSRADSTRPPSRLVNFGDMIKVVVVGNPTEQQLGELEDHFRAINSFPNGTEALRRLRQETERRDQYPIMVFNQATDGCPIGLERRRTARPDERVQLPAPVRRNREPRSEEERQMSRLIRSVSDYLVQSQEGRLTLMRFGIRGRGRRAAMPAGGWNSAQRPQQASARFESMLFDTISRRNAQRGLPLYSIRAGLDPWPTEWWNAHGPLQRRENNDFRRPQLSWPNVLEPWLGADCQAVVGQWEAIEGEAHEEADLNGIAAFKQFLRRLSASQMFQNPTQRAEVVKWLAEAALPEGVILRAEAFEACIEGTRSCEDNILLTWNKLTMLKIKVDAQEGRYEGRLADLLGIALPVFRMQEIEKVADTKVRELYAARKRRDPSMIERGQMKTIDPLETLLAYQIGLRETFNLPIQVGDMNFPKLANVPQDDIDKARASIDQAEKERFPVWLLTEFSPFLAEIERQLGPEMSTEIVEDSVEANADTFDARLVARLRAENMSDGDDERREMGVLLLRDIKYETWLPHANSILIAAGLAPLPSLDLDETERPGSLVDSTLMA